MVQRGHFPQPFEVGDFAREHVVRIDGFEGFGGEAKIHRVARLILKINREARENCVHRPDFPKAPTAVQTKAALGELHQRLHVLSAQLSDRHQFFKLFSHSNNINLACF